MIYQIFLKSFFELHLKFTKLGNINVIHFSCPVLFILNLIRYHLYFSVLLHIYSYTICMYMYLIFYDITLISIRAFHIMINLKASKPLLYCVECLKSFESRCIFFAGGAIHLSAKKRSN